MNFSKLFWKKTRTAMVQQLLALLLAPFFIIAVVFLPEPFSTALVVGLIGVIVIGLSVGLHRAVTNPEKAVSWKKDDNG